MAAASKLVGRFIASSHSKWDEPIVSNDGRQSTPPGESLTVWIFTPHDSDVCKVKVSTVGRNADPLTLQTMRQVADGLEFGAEVVAECGPLAYGAYRGISLHPAKSPAAAAPARVA